MVITMTSRNKVERQSLIAEYWMRPTSDEMDVVDKGDALQIKSSSRDVAAWWLGTLRAMYPQDSYSGEGEHLKMHPEMGVTLKLNRNDGTLTIKGKKHMQWFKTHFDQMIQTGGKQFGTIREMSRLIDSYLRIDDGLSNPDLLEHIPTSGAIRNGPTFVYRLWKGLLDQWISSEGRVYLITPLMDAKRLADVILMVAKHKRSKSRVQLYTNIRCDGELKYPKVYKQAKQMVMELKNSNKKRLIVDDRLKLALERLDVKFGSFHVKLLAWCSPQYTEVLLTSASAHAMHFHHEHADQVLFMRMHSDEFTKNYLAPLGLAPKLDSASAPILSFNDSDSTLTL